MNPVSLWRGALGRLRFVWRPTLTVHIVFTLLGVAIFAPLLGVSGKLLLRLSGRPAVADQDIAVFLLSPFGIFALIVFAALLVGIMAFEQSAMMRAALGYSRQERVLALQALRFTARRAPSVFWFSGHLVARLLLIVLPFAAASGAIALLTITDYDINYYLAEKPPEFIRAAVLISIVLAGGVAVLVRKLVGWSLALPLVLFTDVPPGKSFSESNRCVAGHRPAILWSGLLWAASALLLGAVVLGLVRIIGGLAVPPVAGDLSRLLIVLLLLGALFVTSNFLVTTVTSGHFAALVTSIFERLAVAGGYTPTRNQRGLVSDENRAGALTPGRLAAGLLGAAVLAVIAGTALLNDIRIQDDVLIIAHRGAAGRAPENTLASVRAALEDRADWIEIDVQETADGEVVVVHDSDFMKLSGDPVKVWNVTLDRLADIDVGGWFSSAFAGERVPTLREVLDTARGRANVVIELKYYGHDERLEQRVADIVEATDMAGHVAVMSLKYDGVRKMKELRPDWTVGLLSATAIGDLSRLDTDFLAVSTNMASRGFVQRAHDAGKRVFVWTVNDPVTLSQVITRGVDGIITDEPAMARKILAERAELSTPERLLISASMFFGRDFTAREYRDSSP